MSNRALYLVAREQADTDDRQWRRGLYTHWQRTFLHPMLANFDAPARDECAAARNGSNTPQQALTLLNKQVDRGQAVLVLSDGADDDHDPVGPRSGTGGWRTASRQDSSGDADISGASDFRQ